MKTAAAKKERQTRGLYTMQRAGEKLRLAGVVGRMGQRETETMCVI
jgi:hypothetical protein